jgi:hypothetical protein
MEEGDESDNPVMGFIGGGSVDDCGHVTIWTVPLNATRARALGIPSTRGEWDAELQRIWASRSTQDDA